MDTLKKSDVWVKNEDIHEKHGLPDGSGSPKHLKLIDGDFYDNYIVSRWTSEWLADDTTWVIAMGKRDVPWSEVNLKYALAARSVTILNNHFYEEDPKVRFGVFDVTEWEDL